MNANVSTFLMFTGRAEEAMNFYVSLFEQAKINKIIYYKKNEAGKEGSVVMAEFSLNGQNFMCIDSPGKHNFTFTPSISIYIKCVSEKEIHALYTVLSVGGKIFMELGSYGFSKKFGWVEDRFGISWQLNVD